MNWYAVLSVDERASAKDIRKAYYRAALKYHPDKTAEETEASVEFHNAKQAYTILSDPEQRAAFDAQLGLNTGFKSDTTIRRSQQVADESQYYAEKLASQERESPREDPKSKYNNARDYETLAAKIKQLQEESQFLKDVAADVLEQRELTDSQYRMLADKSRIFDSIEQARHYVDTTPNARLYRSHKRRNYTVEYERETLERIKIRYAKPS